MKWKRAVFLINSGPRNREKKGGVMEELIISADSHVIEVPDLWENGMPQSPQARAPKVYFDEKKDAWLFGSAEVIPQAVGGLFMAGQRPDNLGNFRGGGFSVVPGGGLDS